MATQLTDLQNLPEEGSLMHRICVAAMEISPSMRTVETVFEERIKDSPGMMTENATAIAKTLAQQFMLAQKMVTATLLRYDALNESARIAAIEEDHGELLNLMLHEMMHIAFTKERAEHPREYLLGEMPEYAKAAIFGEKPHG